MTTVSALERLNKADAAEAAQILLPMIERAPMVAKQVAARRPFANAQTLAQAVLDQINALTTEAKLDLFRAHPELAPSAPSEMTEASQVEQGRLGLVEPDAALRQRFYDLNAKYQARFGFPFILALHRMPDVQEVLAVFEARLKQSPEEEIAQACAEIASVSAARIAKAFGTGEPA